MASSRIPYDATSPLGTKFARAVGTVVEARKQMEELQRILDAYLDDEAGLAADSGIPLVSVPLVRNLTTQAANELGGLAVVQVGVGQATGTRQLTDAMG